MKRKKVKEKKPKSDFFWSTSGKPTKMELWFGDMSEPKPTKSRPLDECFGQLDPKRNKLLLTINKRLMKMEKKRRGLPADKLVFIGMANFANYYYCAWKAYSKSIETEMDFFSVYLMDRVALLSRNKNKGLVGKPPIHILNVLSKFSLEDAEESFEKNKFTPKASTSDEKIKKEREINMAEDGKVWGVHAQALYAEKYPTFRWNYAFGDFVLIGVPDGIGEDFVYEFKSTKIIHNLENKLNEARAQADLYGFFFKKPNKIVHAFCIPDKASERRVEGVNKKTAHELLGKWTALTNGELPQPPIRHRCEVCDLRKTCELRKMLRTQEKRDVKQTTLTDFKGA